MNIGIKWRGVFEESFIVYEICNEKFLIIRFYSEILIIVNVFRDLVIIDWFWILDMNE